MDVVTWTLESRTPPTAPPRPVPAPVRLDRTSAVDPEYARFLYGYVGGAWRWTDRLDWTREQWAEELAVPGTVFLLPSADGVPLGYVQLQPVPHDDGVHVEIRYFGLAAPGLGRGLGGPLLEHAIATAWSLPDAVRVWVHTCDLDGPAARPNYEARGLVLCDTAHSDEDVPDAPLGAWVSTGGR
ncbi:acetyltransferase (GNAT) family protein [Curtobacterium sp. PhB130]|uniref:GNAT family N-acetyltransferase n=1 Tax=Curtobacterium sp. PhB130 TaxID=2485178 RepID=UPI000F4B3B26|nr:GNAT family N-acetyltransferase [Curtobacterium sp. PhB130]ROS77967.1 acetyltransferase (GNAT) family protein [Curtobacterium sp. PhB130]